MAEVGAERPTELVADVESYLRALLRDTYCGYLDQDLRRVADDLIVEAGEPIDVSAADLRKQEPEPVELPELDEKLEREYQTAEITVDEPAPRDETAEITLDEHWAPPDPEPFVPEPDDGVTSSVDWGSDDDTGAWSAPV